MNYCYKREFPFPTMQFLNVSNTLYCKSAPTESLSFYTQLANKKLITMKKVTIIMLFLGISFQSLTCRQVYLTCNTMDKLFNHYIEYEKYPIVASKNDINSLYVVKIQRLQSRVFCSITRVPSLKDIPQEYNK